MRALNVDPIELRDGQHHLGQLRVVSPLNGKADLGRKRGREGGREGG